MRPRCGPRGRRGLRGLVLALALAFAFAWSRPAAAVEYEVFIDVDTEEELNDLLLLQQISDTTHETLVELMRRGTDLARASRQDLYALPNLTYEDVDRIIAYREEAGRIHDPADLVAAGVLSSRKLAALAAFLLVPATKAERGGVHGQLRYRGVYVPGDPRVPPMALQARVSALDGLTVGAAALLDPQRLGPARWDPNRSAPVVAPDRARVLVPKAFIQWDTARWAVIAGTYRAGFGQRLTFDNSRRYTPNGLYLDDAVITRYDLTRLCQESAGELDGSPCEDDGISPDRRGAPSFRFSPGLRGVAGGAKALPLPVGWLQAYAFWSMQNHDIYQYRLYDAGQCDDPRRDAAQCDAPPIYREPSSPLAPTSQYRYRTLPNLLDVITQGANVSWFRDGRTHVGLTGYGSVPRWRVGEAPLDLQPAERLPRGGPFGAVGADFAWGRRWSDLFAEVSRSFDAIPAEQRGGGGFAGIVRQTSSWSRHELEVSARYYDARYANPYSRPISARDRFEGNQARDEAGARVRFNGHVAERVDLRTFADVSLSPTTRETRLRLFARADVRASRWWRPGLWLEYQNNDAARPRLFTCIDDTVMPGPVTGIPDDAIICGGQRVQITARSRFDPLRRLYVDVQYRHELQNELFVDDTFSRGNGLGTDIDFETFDPLDEGDLARLDARNGLRQDINAFATIVARPLDPLRLRARIRWFWEDISDNTRFEHSVWAYLDVQYKIRPWAVPSVRYDVYAYVDDRDSTARRRPNPEHWIRVQLQSRF